MEPESAARPPLAMRQEPVRGPAPPAIRLGGLLLGVLVTVGAWLAPDVLVAVFRWAAAPAIAHASRRVLWTVGLLVYGLALVLPAPRRGGLRIGRIREHWWRVLIVCGIPIVAAALVYPRLDEHPFAGMGPEIWLVSPVAQDLIFIGFLYGRLELAFPLPLHPRIPVPRALLVGGIFFAAWHLPNAFTGMSNGYFAFQLAYTYVGFVFVGLARHWTGSVFYPMLEHTGVNFIVWLAH